MNLRSFVDFCGAGIHAGGPGSGCHGPTCGRPSTGGEASYSKKQIYDAHYKLIMSKKEPGRKGRVLSPLPNIESKKEHQDREILDNIDEFENWSDPGAGVGKYAKLESVDLDKVLVDRWQPGVEENQVRTFLHYPVLLNKYAKTPETNKEDHSRSSYYKPRAILLNGKTRILDGHTRAATRYLLGEKKMVFRVIDVDKMIKDSKEKSK